MRRFGHPGTWFRDLFLAPLLLWELWQARREIRQDEKRRVNLLEKFSVRLRFLLHALPLRVVLKGFPIRRCGFAAGMLKDVDQSIALFRFIDRSPIRNALQ